MKFRKILLLLITVIVVKCYQFLRIIKIKPYKLIYIICNITIFSHKFYKRFFKTAYILAYIIFLIFRSIVLKK